MPDSILSEEASKAIWGVDLGDLEEADLVSLLEFIKSTRSTLARVRGMLWEREQDVRAVRRDLRRIEQEDRERMRRRGVPDTCGGCGARVIQMRWPSGRPDPSDHRLRVWERENGSVEALACWDCLRPGRPGMAGRPLQEVVSG